MLLCSIGKRFIVVIDKRFLKGNTGEIQIGSAEGELYKYINHHAGTPTKARSKKRKHWYAVAGRPGSSEVPRNPLTRWDVSSIPANNGIFLTKNLKTKNKNAQRVEND